MVDKLTIWYWDVSGSKGDKDPGVYQLKDFSLSSEAQAWMYANAPKIKIKRITKGDYVFKTELVERPY